MRPRKAHPCVKLYRFGKQYVSAEIYPDKSKNVRKIKVSDTYIHLYAWGVTPSCHSNELYEIT